MKRIACLILSLVMLAGCAAGGASSGTTGQTEPEKEAVLRVGYGRSNISPTESVPLRGYGNTLARMSTHVTERLYATCVAFTDGNDNTVLLYHMDLTVSDGDIMAMNRLAVSKATGVPTNQIMVASTHNHSAPDLAQNSVPSIQDYITNLKTWMVDAAKQAMADRKPAKMYTATTNPKDLNFIRYYIYSDGSVGSGTLPKGTTRVAHYGECDNQMQLVKFVREGGKDVLLVNWQGHPHRDGSDTKTNATSDIVGAMRNYVEKEMDCQFAYFSGASGNVNNHSMIPGVTPTKDYLEHGQALGKAAQDAAANFKEAKIGKVQIIGKNYDAPGKENPNTVVTAPIFAFSLGDVAFITAPYEMFDVNGMAIKKDSPFAMTFVVTYANASCGYFPAEFAYDCDTSYEIRVSRVAKGVAETMVTEYLAMLNELYKTK